MRGPLRASWRSWLAETTLELVVMGAAAMTLVLAMFCERVVMGAVVTMLDPFVTCVAPALQLPRNQHPAITAKTRAPRCKHTPLFRFSLEPWQKPDSTPP